MTHDQDADPAVEPGPARQWRWTGLGLASLLVACGAALLPVHAPEHGGSGAEPVRPGLGAAQAQSLIEKDPPALGIAQRSSPLSGIEGALSGPPSNGAPSDPANPSDRPTLNGPWPPAASLPEGPEGRLIAAYTALGEGETRKAHTLAAELVRDYPQFSLAQMFYGDLLAARAGLPSSFGVDGSEKSKPLPGDKRLALRDEALQRLAALRERPQSGQVPSEFVHLAPSVRHAIAVDTSRSRLYLFANGPQGLSLVRDFYISVGKQGIAKRVEGDRRTPLGVYWVTASVPMTPVDERFGKAALRFNYPNAWDKALGRTGTGLYLHGVSPNVLTHVPWATDGCVAMSNADIEQLRKTVDVDTTPIVIAKQLRWVAPQEVQRAGEEFWPSFYAWDDDRRNQRGDALARWYARDTPIARETLNDTFVRVDVSLVAWAGDELPTMVVTARAPAASPVAGTLLRQYWALQNGRWQIRFDGPVTTSTDLANARANGAPGAASVEPTGADDALLARAGDAPVLPAPKRAARVSKARSARLASKN